MKQVLRYLVVFIAAFGIAGTAGYLGVKAFTRSAPEVVLPNLVGQNILEVLEILTRMGLNPKLHRTQFHDLIPKYGVSFQDPEPGATIKKGRDVVLYISKGFKEIQMPDLRQMPLKEGLLKLEAHEIQMGKILHVYDAGTLKGAVMAQYPFASAKVSAGSTCDILVSRGPETVSRVMPDLEGRTLDQALQVLGTLELEIETVSSGTDPRRPEGVILGQAPPAGSRISASLGVQLTVNRPEAGRPMDLEAFNRSTLVTHRVPMGFSNRHVRVVWDLLDQESPLFNGYMKPGTMINLLIPGGIKTKIRIFIDHELVQVKIIDPWRREASSPWENWHWHLNTGEFTWES